MRLKRYLTPPRSYFNTALTQYDGFYIYIKHLMSGPERGKQLILFLENLVVDEENMIRGKQN